MTSSTETGTEPAATTPPDTNPSIEGAQPPAQGPDGVSGTTALPSSPTEPESATASSVEVAPGVVVSHSGGAQTSARSLERAPEPKKSGKSKQDAAPSNAQASAAESSRRTSVDSDTASVTGFSPSADASPAPSAKQSSPPTTFAAAMTMNAPAQESPSPKPVAAPPSMVKVVLGALAAAFGANSSGPTQPATSPAAWVVAAVTRRELGDVPAASAENVSLARTAAVTNSAPVNPTATVGTPNASTGVVTGTVKATDPDGNTLTYTTPASTTKGTVTITTAGAFTYTPTAAARHAAAAVNAPAATTQDTFTVTISDGLGGTITKAVTVPVLGKNTAPTGYANVGWPDGTTGVVTGYVSAGDADYDPLTFSTTNTAKGTVTVNTTGGFTYTPTAAARHAAAAVNAPAAAKQDTFTVAVKDGYGGTTNVNITVTIAGKNTAPNATATVMNTNLRTGVATGAITVADPDDSTFTYTSTTSTKGSLAIAPNGSFTYTPTLAAQQAATGPNATAAAKQDTFNITIDDGYGGRATAVLNVAVTPIGANSPITNVKTTVGQPNSAIGEVKGTVKAVDPEGDVLTYTLTSGPTKGSVTVDSATGAFTYTPTSEARYDATVRPGQVVDSFTVTVRDAFGASASATVTAVPVAPYSASAIDQRPTSVGVSDPYLYFASQAETDHILDTLHASGIDTVRILVPWAGVEPVDNTYNWTAIDRMVTSARARDMTIVATLNSTPDWAVTPGTPVIIGAPANPQQYADFAGAVAARYVGRISAYEIWNEPNGKIFWEPGPDAAQYTAILKPAYLAIKAADPNATVVAGSVGYIATEPGKNINAVEFIQQMYANGAAGYFDAIAFHPYQYSYPFSVPDPYQVGPRSEAEKIHQLMVANGDGAKLIWATEYGQPTNFEGGVDRQAQFLADFLRTWREIDYAGPAYLFTTRDGTYSDPVENSFGLYNADWSPKPAVDAVEEVIDENDAMDERNL
ncbi:MAG TPA: Ig-like domain-containing protein [Mycobacterium sp.]